MFPQEIKKGCGGGKKEKPALVGGKEAGKMMKDLKNPRKKIRSTSEKRRFRRGKTLPQKEDNRARNSIL